MAPEPLRKALGSRLSSRNESWVLLEAEEVEAAGAPFLADQEITHLVWSPDRARRDPPSRIEGLVDACRGAGLEHLVLLSSAAVCAPSHHHPGHVDEDRLPARGAWEAIPAWWRGLEVTVEEGLAGTETRLVVLRPASVLVPGGGDDFLGRLFGGGWAVTLPGHDPSLQLLSVDDLAAAVEHALGAGRSGVYFIAPRGVVPLRKGLRLAGVRRLVVPRWMQRLGRAGLARLGLAAPSDELEQIRYPWTVSGERARRELAFEPRDSSAGAILAQRRRELAEELPEYDPFGLDPEYCALYGRTLWRFLHDVYWRIEVEGLEHVPRSGPAVVTGIHRGFMPWDGVMAFHAVARATGRHLRFLLHPSLLKMPHLFNYMSKSGGLLACRENADWVLERGEMVGMFPDGIRGAFTPYRRAYEMGRFTSDDYVRMALRHSAPIVPFVTVGSAEIFPILVRIEWRWWQRFTEWPCFPIAPPFPLLPVPLPSKWHTRYLEPIPTDGYPAAAADDPEIVGRLSAEVRAKMDEAWQRLRARRRHLFWGRLRSA